MALGRAFFAIVVMAFVLAACGDSKKEGGDTDIPPATPIEPDAFARDYAAAFCTSIAPCCASQSYAHDTDVCRAVLEAALTALVRYYQGQPNVSFDQEEAGRCVNAVRTAYSACTDRDAYEAVDDGCDMFRGTVPTGGSCHESFECADSGNDSVSCETGVCTEYSDPGDPFDAPHATSGAACNYTCDTSGSCSGSGGDTVTGVCWTSDGLVCGSSGTCVAAPTVGSACVSYHCGVDAHCEGTVCVVNTATGPCPGGDGDCLSTSYCDYTGDSSQCVPRKANGELCDSSYECVSDKCVGDRCVPWSAANPELCAGLVFD